ncbi:RNA polymerase sigma factor [Nannocystaceae bacterium ST9]
MLTPRARPREGRIVPPGFPDEPTLRKLHRDLHQFFHRRLPSDCDSDDYVAEVLLTLRNYRGSASSRSYAFGVAHRMLASAYRRPRRTGSLETAMNEPAADLPSPSTALRRRQTASMLRSEVEAINPVYGEVVRLRLDGHGPAEIAERLGVPSHTVRSRFARGLAQLRERLAGRRDTIEL